MMSLERAALLTFSLFYTQILITTYLQANLPGFRRSHLHLLHHQRFSGLPCYAGFAADHLQHSTGQSVVTQQAPKNRLTVSLPFCSDTF